MTSIHRARNAAASWLRYEVHPSDQFRIMEQLEADGEELAAIYHSHTEERGRALADGHQPGEALARRPLADLLARGPRRAGRPRRSGSATARSRRRISTSSDRPLVCRGCGRSTRATGRATLLRELRDAAQPGGRRRGGPGRRADRAGAEDPAAPRPRRARCGWRSRSNLAEAELIQGILLEEGIPSILRRSGGFDVPDFLAAGPARRAGPRVRRRGGARAARLRRDGRRPSGSASRSIREAPPSGWRRRCSPACSSFGALDGADLGRLT